MKNKKIVWFILILLVLSACNKEYSDVSKKEFVQMPVLEAFTGYWAQTEENYQNKFYFDSEKLIEKTISGKELTSSYEISSKWDDEKEITLKKTHDEETNEPLIKMLDYNTVEITWWEKPIKYKRITEDEYQIDETKRKSQDLINKALTSSNREDKILGYWKVTFKEKGKEADIKEDYYMITEDSINIVDNGEYIADVDYETMIPKDESDNTLYLYIEDRNRGYAIFTEEADEKLGMVHFHVSEWLREEQNFKYTEDSMIVEDWIRVEADEYEDILDKN